MAIKNYEWKSDFAKAHRAEGYAEGYAEGTSQRVIPIEQPSMSYVH